jgi:hypothetical protein
MQVMFEVVPGSSLNGQLLLRESTNNGWLNGSDCFRWIPSETRAGGLSFIWPSEQSGFRHLYRFEVTGLRSSVGASAYTGPSTDVDGLEVVPCKATAPFSRIQHNAAARYADCITEGEFVVDKIIGVSGELIFFQAVGADSTTPTELHVCCASLAVGSSGGIVRITSGAGTHKATMSADCSVMSVELSSLYTKESSLSFYSLNMNALNEALARREIREAPKQWSPAASSLGAAFVDFARSGEFVDETSSNSFITALGVAHGLVPVRNAAELVFTRHQKLVSGLLSGNAAHAIAEVLDEQRAEAAAVPSRFSVEPLQLRSHSTCGDALSLDALQIPIIVQITAADGTTPMYGALTLPFEAAPVHRRLPTVV